MTLKPSEAKAFYDRFGAKQDSQRFYEDPALDDLVAHAHWGEAQRVFEFGSGTGRLADRLLSRSLPAQATYRGCDLSPTMVRLAQDRLTPYGERAQVLASEGTVNFGGPDHSTDCVLSTYVLDLLSETAIGDFFKEAHRVLDVGGGICLVSLTQGTTPISRFVSAVWMSVFRSNPALVGGCRPIRLVAHLDPRNWEVEYRNVVIAFGIPSEVVIARTRYTPDSVNDALEQNL